MTPPEYNALHPDAKDAYDERIAILSEGSPITEIMVQIATREARQVQSVKAPTATQSNLFTLTPKTTYA